MAHGLSARTRKSRRFDVHASFIIEVSTLHTLRARAPLRPARPPSFLRSATALSRASRTFSTSSRLRPAIGLRPISGAIQTLHADSRSRLRRTFPVARRCSRKRPKYRVHVSPWRASCCLDPRAVPVFADDDAVAVGVIEHREARRAVLGAGLVAGSLRVVSEV